MCLIAIPVDNASLNPARSIAVALYGQPWAWEQLWVFLISPTGGAVLAGLSYGFIFGLPSRDSPQPLRSSDAGHHQLEGDTAACGPMPATH